MTLASKAQLRAARALLDWSRDDLARESGLSAVNIKRLESADADWSQAKVGTMETLVETFRAHGVTFAVECGGVSVSLATPAA